MAQAIFEPKFFPYDTPTFFKPSSTYTYLPMKIAQSRVLRNVKKFDFRHRGITQKKAYNIQNMVKV
jgi:hypothetical protein